MTVNKCSIWFVCVLPESVQQGCILSPCLFKLYAEEIMRNAGLHESQAGIEIARRNNNLRYAEMAYLSSYSLSNSRKWRGLKSLLMSVKKENEKAGLKLKIQKKKRSWHPVLPLYGKYEGGKWNQWYIFFSWAPKSLWTMIAATKLKGACSLEGKLWQT